jgi:glutamyl-tRNA synthetase
MTVAVRFAPSPTGRLHVGNVRVALANRLFASRHGGTFLLRLDDTDAARSTEAYARGIEDDLRWLGLGWDRFARQSDRLPRYAEAAERLRAAGRLYPCYETDEELETAKRLQQASGRPPRYDRAALRLTADDRARLEAEGRRPHWRFLLGSGTIAWDDMVQGPKSFDAADLSDPVALRADGQPLYLFSSVVDDIDHAVTHVIRGEDHVTNTAVQIDLFRALGAEPPAFAHLPLVTDLQGKGLSKRDESISLAALRADGIEPRAVVAMMAALGTSAAPDLGADMDELARRFDLGSVSRSPPKFDPAELARLSAQAVRAMPFDEAAPRLRALGLDGADERFWLAVRGNLDRVADAAGWWRIAAEPIGPVREDPELLAAAAALLPPEPWDGDTWRAWTDAVKAATGRSGKRLFLPLRLALTGRPTGPDLGAFLPCIGRWRTLQRLGAGD